MGSEAIVLHAHASVGMAPGWSYGPNGRGWEVVGALFSPGCASAYPGLSLLKPFGLVEFCCFVPMRETCVPKFSKMACVSSWKSLYYSHDEARSSTKCCFFHRHRRSADSAPLRRINSLHIP